MAENQPCQDFAIRCTVAVMIVERAYAKLNLTLEVIRKRDDGYHDLASVIQTVDLHDTLELIEAERISLECSDGSIAGSENLVVKAAEALQQESGIDLGASIKLTKRIPVSAGLGGGSADAAAALRGLNRLWDLQLGERELVYIAERIGSDVPFLVSGGTAFVSGRGERLDRLPTPEVGRFVVVSPKSGEETLGPSKTARMFATLTEKAHTTGSLTRKLAARMLDGGDCHPAFMFNVFQPIAPHAFPDWQAIYDAFAGLGASDIVLSGAGPSMFAIAPSKEIATAWALVMKARTNCDAFAVGTVPRIEVDESRKIR